MNLILTDLKHFNSYRAFENSGKILDHQINKWGLFNQKGFKIEKDGKKANEKTVRKVSNGLIRKSAREYAKCKQDFKNLNFINNSFGNIYDKKD